MNPFYFGANDRRLFGLYTPGRAGMGRAKAAVLCNPWGQEYLRAHRSLRQLAIQLSGAGWHVLRFDYFGTGDSAADMQDADMNGWERDIEVAVEELMDTSGVTRVSLVGLRLGAAMAARVAAKRKKKDVESLVLWDPVVTGAEYLDELYHNGKLIGPFGLIPRSDALGGNEILGFRLSAAMTEEFRAIDLLTQLPLMPTKSIIITSKELNSHAALRSSAMEHGVMVERLPSPPVWLELQDLGVGVIPVNVIQRIVEWLA